MRKTRILGIKGTTILSYVIGNSILSLFFLMSSSLNIFNIISYSTFNILNTIIVYFYYKSIKRLSHKIQELKELQDSKTIQRQPISLPSIILRPIRTHSFSIYESQKIKYLWDCGKALQGLKGTRDFEGKQLPNFDIARYLLQLGRKEEKDVDTKIDNNKEKLGKDYSVIVTMNINGKKYPFVLNDKTKDLFTKITTQILEQSIHNPLDNFILNWNGEKFELVEKKIDRFI